jgi:hypothetical protein
MVFLPWVLLLGTKINPLFIRQQWNVEPLTPDQTFEQRCLDEFWNKQPKGFLESLQQNTVEARVFATQFRELLNKFDKNLYILSDNPTFDCGYINYYLDYFGLDSMQFGSDGKSYRVIHDSDSYACGIVKAPITYNWPNDSDIRKILHIEDNFVSNTLVPYNPTDDATKIFIHFTNILKNAALTTEEFIKLI